MGWSSFLLLLEDPVIEADFPSLISSFLLGALWLRELVALGSKCSGTCVGGITGVGTSGGGPNEGFPERVTMLGTLGGILFDCSLATLFFGGIMIFSKRFPTDGANMMRVKLG